jgi:hypothetical protein
MNYVRTHPGRVFRTGKGVEISSGDRLTGSDRMVNNILK